MILEVRQYPAETRRMSFVFNAQTITLSLSQKYCYHIRVVDILNSLHFYFVSSQSIYAFKSRLRPL